MSTATIRSLQALRALAHIELGEAALELADRLDVQKKAADTLARSQSEVRQLGAVYERLASPGASLNVGALGAVARQVVASEAGLHDARSQAREADDAVDAQRQLLHHHQASHESLDTFLTAACRQHAADRESAAAREREDLFLARRHLSSKVLA